MRAVITKFTPGPGLFELYAKYVGEPQSRKDVYGYWIFLLGSIVSFLGVVVYLVGPQSSRPADIFFVREIAVTLSAFGLPVVLFGITLLLPVRQRSIQASAVGVATTFVAIAWFVDSYPDQWVLRTTDYSTEIMLTYTVGLAVVVGVAALVPVLTGEKSFFFEAEYERSRAYPDTMVGQTLRDGLFAVYNDGGGWSWRFLEQDAMAGSVGGFDSHLGTEETVERIKDKVGEAGLLEITHAAFRLYEADDGRWRWLLMREDGNVVADSGDAFDSRETAERAVGDLKDFGPDAPLLTIEGAAFDWYREGGEWHWQLVDEEREQLARGAASFDDRAAAEAAVDEVTAATVDADTLVVDELGAELHGEGEEWRWRLVNADGTPAATGVDGFGSRRTAESAVHDLLADVPDAPVVRADEPAFEVTPIGETWDWRFVDDGEQTIARGNLDATDGGPAARAARRARDATADADIVIVDDTEFEYYRDGDEWHWRLVTRDREVIAESTTPFDSREATADAVEEVQVQAGAAELIEFEEAAFQLYETDGEWRWRLIDEDGNVMADSGEQHSSREGAAASMTTLKENAPDADLLEIETAAFELFHDDEDRWHWRLVDEGGETTARGAGDHATEADAREAMERLVEHAGDTPSRAMDAAAFQVFPTDDEWAWRLVHPDDTLLAVGEGTFSTRDEATATVDGTIREAMAGASVHVVESAAFYLDERPGGWSWRLCDARRTERASSIDSFEDREAARASVDAIQRRATGVQVFELDEPTYLLRGRDGAWSWALVDEDWTDLMVGRTSHGRREDAEAAMVAVLEAVPDAGTVEYDEAAFEVHERDDRWHWRLVDEGESVIAAGAEGYDSREAAAEGVDDVRAELDDASVLEVDTAAFELHEDGGEWRWRLIDEDGNPLGESAASFPSRKAARDGMEVVKEYAPDAMTLVAE